MNIEKKFRHEFKYICSESQLSLIDLRIKSLLCMDSHTNGSDRYCIRSLYFDDIHNSCFYENENGVNPREKYRIRIYNQDSRHIRLELKSKHNGKTQKDSCLITLEQCICLMRGEELHFSSNNPPVLQKLWLAMKLYLIKPKIIVEYDRSPYVYKNGNVRITLDRNIASSSAVELFLEKHIPRRQIMQIGQGVLEVKYDEYLSDYIYRILNFGNLHQEAFSKYYLCRKYNMSGERL